MSQEILVSLIKAYVGAAVNETVPLSVNTAPDPMTIGLFVKVGS